MAEVDGHDPFDRLDVPPTSLAIYGLSAPDVRTRTRRSYRHAHAAVTRSGRTRGRRTRQRRGRTSAAPPRRAGRAGADPHEAIVAEVPERRTLGHRLGPPIPAIVSRTTRFRPSQTQRAPSLLPDRPQGAGEVRVVEQGDDLVEGEDRARRIGPGVVAALAVGATLHPVGSGKLLMPRVPQPGGLSSSDSWPALRFPAVPMPTRYEGCARSRRRRRPAPCRPSLKRDARSPIIGHVDDEPRPRPVEERRLLGRRDVVDLDLQVLCAPPTVAVGTYAVVGDCSSANAWKATEPSPLPRISSSAICHGRRAMFAATCRRWTVDAFRSGSTSSRYGPDPVRPRPHLEDDRRLGD